MTALFVLVVASAKLSHLFSFEDTGGQHEIGFISLQKPIPMAQAIVSGPDDNIVVVYSATHALYITPPRDIALRVACGLFLGHKVCYLS